MTRTRRFYMYKRIASISVCISLAKRKCKVMGPGMVHGKETLKKKKKKGTNSHHRRRRRMI